MRGYHEYRGGVQYCGGINLLLFEYPKGTEHPHGAHDIPDLYHDTPTGIMISPHGTQITKDGIPPQY